jgi:hypothetical protein
MHSYSKSGGPFAGREEEGAEGRRRAAASSRASQEDNISGVIPIFGKTLLIMLLQKCYDNKLKAIKGPHLP